MIQVQGRDRGTPGGREAGKHRAPPAEVDFPRIPARMLERAPRSSLWVRRMRAIRLVQVAARAGERQVPCVRCASASAWGDMLDMKRRSLERLAHATILAAVPGALPNQCGESGRNTH